MTQETGAEESCLDAVVLDRDATSVAGFAVSKAYNSKFNLVDNVRSANLESGH
jgi:hypothetical protein